MASSARVRTVLWSDVDPVGASSVVVRPGAPFGDGGSAQAVALGQDAGRFLRRLEFGSNSRRCSGAAVKTACYSASSAPRVRVASRLYGNEHYDGDPVSLADWLLRLARNIDSC